MYIIPFYTIKNNAKYVGEFPRECYYICLFISFFSFLFLFFFYKASRFILPVQIVIHCRCIFVWLERINPFAYDWHIHDLIFKYPTTSNYPFIHIYIYTWYLNIYVYAICIIYIYMYIKIDKKETKFMIKKKKNTLWNRIGLRNTKLNISLTDGPDITN